MIKPTINKLQLKLKEIIEFGDDIVDPTVLAASLEGVVPPGLLLAEALEDGLGPMVLP